MHRINNKEKKMQSLVINPTTISLLTTNKCTAACKNCCFNCNSQNNARMTLSEMKQYIDDSLKAYPTIKLLVLTGGECFTLKDDLKTIIRYAKEKKLLVRCVSNGYWATSFKKAYLTLKDLIENGLSEINFSTGDEHLKWVSLDNIVNGIIASVKLKITVCINRESSVVSTFKHNDLINDSRLKKYKNLLDKQIKIVSGIWMPFTKSSEEELSLKSKIKNTRISRCDSLFTTISINPHHKMFACCGLTSNYIPCLYLGDTTSHSIKELYEYQFSDFVKIWLYNEGPKIIMEFISKIEPKYSTVDVSNWHICRICAYLLTNSEIMEIIRNNYQKVYTNIMLKHILKQTIVNNK